jgi:SAM-dependent methyltransferase
MEYGSSNHYLGDRGKAYFASQNSLAQKEATVTSWKFRPWVNPTDRVLDFGCAGGWILHNLDCAQRVGVELNPEAHSVCQQNGVKVYSWLHEVEESGIDVAISHHCLEHVPYPIEALKSLRGLLKEGGRLVLVVPLDDWRVEKDFTGQDRDHHLHTWTPRLLANTLVEAQFRVDRVDVLAHALFPGWSSWGLKLPQPIFDALCCITAIAKKRRQLFALATK